MALVCLRSFFPRPLSDQSEAANGELPFRWIVHSAAPSYGVVNWTVKQIRLVNLSAENLWLVFK